MTIAVCSRLRLAAALLVLGGAGAILLASRGTRRGAESSAGIERSEIYERTRRVFRGGRILQPADRQRQAGTLLSDLAPLILFESSLAGPSPGPLPRFGSPRSDSSFSAAPSRLRVSAPTLFHHARPAPAIGPHWRVATYSWWVLRAAGGPRAARWRRQAVRLLVDDRIGPRVAEVSNGPAGWRVVYVSAALERAARKQFGPPLPGRAHAVEPGPGECQEVVVARVLEEAPVPLGPWVYISREGEVTTLLCRCMPAQALPPLVPAPYRLLTSSSESTPSRLARSESPDLFPTTAEETIACLRLARSDGSPER